MARRLCKLCGERLESLRTTRKFCSDACRVASHRKAKPNAVKVYTAMRANNDTLVARAASLYIKDGDSVADVTYGKGNFWTKTNTKRFNLLKSDIVTCPDAPYDFRDLPYDEESIDHVFLDPPYQAWSSKPLVERQYRNAETTKGYDHDDIIELYEDGMVEAGRVLRGGGLLWVKCQDELAGGAQHWSHIEIEAAATKLGFSGIDLFVLLSYGVPPIQHRQKHARKNHSYLWVFQKANGQ